MHLAIFQAIRNCTHPNGMSITELQTTFKQMSKQEIRNIMDFLYHEGHVFTSIDADHVMATEAE